MKKLLLFLVICSAAYSQTNIAPTGVCTIDYNGNRLPNDPARTEGHRLIDNTHFTFVEFPYLIEQPSEFKSPEIVIDLAEIHEIQSLRITTFSGNSSLRPVKFSIYYGVDSDVSSLLEKVESNQKTEYNLELQNTIDARFIKITIDSIVSNNSTVLSEVEIFSPDDVTSAEDDIVHFDFRLDQNYPNPFNPTTNISYRIAETGLVILKVYDTLGNEVAVLANEEKIPGEYEASFSGTDLASGIYFYSLFSGSKVLTNKMLLLK